MPVNLNWSVFQQKSGILKLLTVIVGAIDVGLMGSAFYPIYNENPFLIVICFCLAISSFYFLALFFGSMSGEGRQRKGELIYHLVAAILIFMTASGYFFSVVGRSCGGYNCGDILARRYMAAILGFINAFLYAAVVWSLLDIRIVSIET